MKKVLIYVPVVLSLVVLGAHFMRYGSFIGVVAAVTLASALLFQSGALKTIYRLNHDE